MATIKVKLRPSSVVGRAGTVYYQVTHRRATQQITTNIRLQPEEWDAIGEQVAVSVADKSIIQNRFRRLQCIRMSGNHWLKVKNI